MLRKKYKTVKAQAIFTNEIGEEVAIPNTDKNDEIAISHNLIQYMKAAFQDKKEKRKKHNRNKCLVYIGGLLGFVAGGLSAGMAIGSMMASSFSSITLFFSLYAALGLGYGLSLISDANKEVKAIKAIDNETTFLSSQIAFESSKLNKTKRTARRVTTVEPVEHILPEDKSIDTVSNLQSFFYNNTFNEKEYLSDYQKSPLLLKQKLAGTYSPEAIELIVNYISELNQGNAYPNTINTSVIKSYKKVHKSRLKS